MGDKGFICKAICGILLSISVIFSIIYYAKCYITNNYLIFTKSDKIILLLLLFSILIVSLLLIIILIYVIKLRQDITIILEELASVEDNCIKVDRQTQRIIMNLSKKLGVMTYQKKDQLIEKY